MVISTQYGLMFMKMKIYDAPLTCLNMYKLAKINCFANSFFHRVVPNFVIQLGDMTGTGEGGPGYSIRTEYLRSAMIIWERSVWHRAVKTRKGHNGSSLTALPHI